MDKLQKALYSAIRKYGNTDLALIHSDVPRNWLSNAAFTSIELEAPDDYTIRNAILGQGRILEEDLENHMYITTIQVASLGKPLALMVIARNGRRIDLAAYGHEGWIKQHIADKAIQQILKRLDQL